MSYSGRFASLALALVACSSPNLGASAHDAGHADATVDAPPPDASPPLLGPSLVFDDLHLASAIGEGGTLFSTVLGTVLNSQLTMAVQKGQILLGAELVGLDDPSGQIDPMLTVSVRGLVDTDMDATNNFNPDMPEVFHPNLGAMAALTFDPASIAAGGKLHAEAMGAAMLPTVPLPLQDAKLDGTLTATTDGKHVRTLENGRLSGGVPAKLIAAIPNPLGASCAGATLLDALVSGCGLPVMISIQPDVDLDGDGLETFHISTGSAADQDAGIPTGHIDSCTDGDGTVIPGANCINDPRIADGYKLVFVVHGVRAIVLAQ